MLHFWRWLQIPNTTSVRKFINKARKIRSFGQYLSSVSVLMLVSTVAADNHIDVHEYSVSVDYSLSRLWVEARFASPVESVTARSSDAGKFLIDVRGCDVDKKIRMRNRRMMLPEDGIRCINYAVDLARAARHDRSYRDLAVGNTIVSPSLWLWRPEVTDRSEIRVSFRLPHDVRVSVPWQPLSSMPDTYRMGRSPESSNAVVLFGKFDYEEIEIPGAKLRVSIARGQQKVDTQAIFKWIGTTAGDISLAYGRYPNPSPQVVVVPVFESGGDSAVPFGRVIRDGGETVQFFINPEKPLADYMADWTATHEFSHLMLPYLTRRHRWMSEGFAQYYQNVLLARTGTYDEVYAWQKLYDGFERGRQSRPELSPNEAADGDIRSGLMKVYWSGAALALMADVQLRERSGGRESLDTVLGQLQNCCLPADRVWTGTELFIKLDTLIDEPVFMPLYRRYADTAGFPDTSDLLARLGVAVNDDKVRIRRNGELAGIRASITKPDPATARERQSMAAR